VSTKDKQVQELVASILEIEISAFEKPHSEATLQEAVLDKNKEFFVVQNSKGESVGYISLLITPDFCDIWSIAVKKEYQNQGWGKKLMHWALEKSAEKKVFLEVEASNAPALALYKKYGFQIIDRRIGYYGTRRDALIMKKEKNNIY
jgi:ribosomal-protein-alanine N-acetyltransferase